MRNPPRVRSMDLGMEWNRKGGWAFVPKSLSEAVFIPKTGDWHCEVGILAEIWQQLRTHDQNQPHEAKTYPKVQLWVRSGLPAIRMIAIRLIVAISTKRSATRLGLLFCKPPSSHPRMLP